jgi:hypothetical protein
MPGIYDDVGFDAYGAGREARNQLNNVQAFGRGVKQVASGVAEMPGKTWDGMNAAAAPLLDRHFDAMAAQGNAIRGAGANFMRGFNGPADAPYAEDAPRIASPRAALPAPATAQRPDDIAGSAARIQAANPRGSQGVPQMARTLVQESQQRFAPQQGVEGSIGVDGYMRQLQNIRALGQMDTPAGPGILGGDGPTWQERQNAETTSKWAQEDWIDKAKNNPHLQSVINQLIQSENTRGVNERNVAGRMNELALQGQNQFGVESLRGRNQLTAEGTRGANQLTAEGMRGANQLAATRMQGENQFGVEGMRRAGRMDELTLQGDNQLALQDARQQTEAPWRTSQAGWYDAQTRKLNDETDQGASQVGRLQKLTAMYGKDFGLPPDEARRAALKDILGADRAARMANGGVVGYAEGGGVAPMSRAQQLLADMDAKYGKTAGNAPAPAPQPAPVPPPMQQQPQGWFDRTKSAIGGYGQPSTSRGPVEARAYGGQVGGKQPGETDQGYLARISNQGQAYTAGFGKPELPSGVPGMVSYEPGGVQRRSVDGIDHITDPNAPGGANYQPAPPSGLTASGGYGTYSGSGQARGVTPWDQTAGGQTPQPPLGETPLMGSAEYNRPTGLAFGGAVPAQDIPGGQAVAQAVAGRQVFGQSDGSGRDDALPAVIDGERPAALTSGEFVWPVNAVKFYGMDRLNKMLAAAEKGMASQGDTA